MSHRLLLDTCTFLWIIRDAPELSPMARELFADTENSVYLSTISMWEISIKHGLGKLPLATTPNIYVPAERKRHHILSLPLEEDAIGTLSRLPSIHNDPFDRMLVCQAIAHGLTILTPDPLIQQYPVNVKW